MNNDYITISRFHIYDQKKEPATKADFYEFNTF